MDMNKRGLDYAISMMLVVIIVLPFLFLQLTSKVAETKKSFAEVEAAFLKAPYSKENIITYLEKSAELSLPGILSNCQAGITNSLNQELDKYIDAYNAKSPTTKLPKNNYELYIEGRNIHAIAILPVRHDLTLKGMTYENVGTIWFAPSFTIDTKTDLSTCKV
jgi:hypothetical protein